MQELLEYSNVDLLNLYAHTATVMHSELLGCLRLYGAKRNQPRIADWQLWDYII